jgi:acyl carrier protein
MKTTIESVSRLIANRSSLDTDEIKPHFNLQDIGLDKIDIAELLFDAEDYFFIKLPLTVSQSTTVQELASMLDTLLTAM